MTINQPNYTMIPNDLIENMGELSGGELKMLLAICRKTIGYHKNTDRISHGQIHEMTGMSVNAIKQARAGLVEKQLITYEVIGTGKATQTWYDLKMSEIYVSKNDTKDPVNMSKNDIKTDANISKSDTTKESIKEKRKESAVFQKLKETYNTYLLKLYSQDQINNIIFGDPKERRQHVGLLKRFKSETDFKQFLEKAYNDKWLKENGFLPSLLNSQYARIQAKAVMKKPEPEPDYYFPEEKRMAENHERYNKWLANKRRNEASV